MYAYGRTREAECTVFLLQFSAAHAFAVQNSKFENATFKIQKHRGFQGGGGKKGGRRRRTNDLMTRARSAAFSPIPRKENSTRHEWRHQVQNSKNRRENEGIVVVVRSSICDVKHTGKASQGSDFGRCTVADSPNPGPSSSGAAAAPPPPAAAHAPAPMASPADACASPASWRHQHHQHQPHHQHQGHPHPQQHQELLSRYVQTDPASVKRSWVPHEPHQVPVLGLKRASLKHTFTHHVLSILHARLIPPTIYVAGSMAITSPGSAATPSPGGSSPPSPRIWTSATTPPTASTRGRWRSLWSRGSRLRPTPTTSTTRSGASLSTPWRRSRLARSNEALFKGRDKQ